MHRAKAASYLGCILSIFALMLLGCTRDYLFDDSRIPSSNLPKALLFDPAGGLQDVPVNAKISVLFSEPMDRRSVAKSLHIRYGSSEAQINEAAWSAFDEDRLFIYNDQGLILPPHTQITVTLDTSAKDLEGFHIEKDLKWSFSTSPDQEGDEANPAINQSTLLPALDEVVNLDTPVSIEFTEGMLRGTVERSFKLQSIDAGESDERDYDDGLFVWSGNQVVFTPKEPLKKKDAVYEVSLNNNGITCLDLAGNPLSGSDRVPVPSFYTISDNVIYVSPSGSNTNAGTNKHAPKATISGAIRAVQNPNSNGFGYDTIKVAEGEYYDDVVMIDDISIYGGYPLGFEVGSPSNKTIVYPFSSLYTFVFPGVSNCKIENLTINGPPTSPAQPDPEETGALLIRTNSNRIGSEDITIYNCRITGTAVSANNPVGVCIEDSNNITLRGNTIITGGSGIEKSIGVKVRGSQNGVRIYENAISGGTSPSTIESIGIDVKNATVSVFDNQSIAGGTGNSGAHLIGIRIEGLDNESEIRSNQSIKGGSAGDCYGIYVSNVAKPVIRDNARIIGGSTSSGSAYGIFVKEQADPRIVRNEISGGEITGGSGKAYGVYFDNDVIPSFYCLLFNNFILGGNQRSSLLAFSYGVYIRNTNILIVNNTIDGGGYYDGSTAATANIYGIFATVDTKWPIRPIIINNYILGGNSITSYGIRLYSDSMLPLSCEIFNNIFNFSDIVSNASFVGIGTTGVSSLGDISLLNGSTGASYFTPAPKFNYDDPNFPDTTFVGWSDGDYHIVPTHSATVANRGYSGEQGGILPKTLYSQSEILIDIDGFARSIENQDGTTNYSLIDLGAEEVQ